MAKKATLRDIADKAGVSRSVVSRALKNHPTVAKDTRQRILDVAESLNYRIDPLASKLMSSYASRGDKNSGTVIGWINTSPHRDLYHSFPWQKDFLTGAKERAKFNNVKLEEFWLGDPDLSAKRLNQILTYRGIRGVIFPHPKSLVDSYDLKMDEFASITLCSNIEQDDITQVQPDDFENMSLILSNLENLGYRRIGLVVNAFIDWAQKGKSAACMLRYQMFMPKSRCVKICFMQNDDDPHATLLKWVGKEKPDCIIAMHGETLEWLEDTGLKVPQDIGLVTTNISEHTQDWAGIDIDQKKLGATALDACIAQMGRFEYGSTSNARKIYLPGKWIYGKTVKPQQ